MSGGPTSYEGRVEICFNGVWGTLHGSPVSFLAWSEVEAIVVCSQLGFNISGKCGCALVAVQYKCMCVCVYVCMCTTCVCTVGCLLLVLVIMIKLFLESFFFF